jgi:Flp pilus assembly pilin Flp
MSLFIERAIRFQRSDRAATSTEYAVVLAFVLLVCLASIGALGVTVTDLYEPFGGLRGS